MTHTEKLLLARKMLTRKEVKEHVSPFSNAYWKARHDKISDRELVKQDQAAINHSAKKVDNMARHAATLSPDRNTKAGWPYPDGMDVL